MRKKALWASLSILMLIGKASALETSQDVKGNTMSDSTDRDAPLKVICVRTKLKKGVVEEVRNWLNTLISRKYELLETFRDEGVWVESAFLEQVGDEYYLLYYMRADDVKQAMEIFQKSSHPIDQFHRECWNKYAEDTTILEQVFDLEKP